MQVALDDNAISRQALSAALLTEVAHLLIAVDALSTSEAQRNQINASALALVTSTVALARSEADENSPA